MAAADRDEPRPGPAAEPAAGSPSDGTQKVSALVARAIARHVASEGLAPGTMLEPEQEMARRFQVGRSSIREALRLLEAQGLITIRRGVGGGPAVAAPSAADLGRTMTMFLQMRSTPLHSVIDAGAQLEGMMAALAAESVAGDGASVEPLREALAQESALVERDERLFAGMRFHREVHLLAGNEVLHLLVSAVDGIVADRTRAYRHDHWEPVEQRRSWADHLELFEAIVRGDPAMASEIARRHMLGQAERDLEVHPELGDAIVDWR